MFRIACVTMVAVFALAIGFNVWAEDDKIPLDKVPQAVLNAVKAKYPKAEIVAAEKGDQDGTIVYELDLKEGDKKWEVAFTPEGKFVSTEEVLKEADLPAAVRDAFKLKYPDAKIVGIEKETTGDGNAAKVVFEIVIEKGKEKVEVQFDPTGKFLGEEKVK